MTKLIIGIAIAAIAITLMTLSNYAYSDPTGDRIQIIVQTVEIQRLRSAIVGPGPETPCLPATFDSITARRRARLLHRGWQ